MNSKSSVTDQIELLSDEQLIQLRGGAWWYPLKWMADGIAAAARWVRDRFR